MRGGLVGSVINEAAQRPTRQIIVIDRKVAFTGGMNIGEEYGSSIRAHSDSGWRDTFMRIEGSVALELAAVFAEGWDRAKGPPLPGLEYVSWSEGIVVPPLGSAQALGESLFSPAGQRDLERDEALIRSNDAFADLLPDR